LPLSKYRPLDACWQPAIGSASGRAASVPYLHLARTLDALEATRSRLDKERILTNAFRTMLAMGCGQAEVEASAYLFAPAKDVQSGGHRLRPEWSAGARPLGLSRACLTNAICEAVGGTHARLSQINKSLRDTGLAAVELRDGGGGTTRQQRLGFALPPPPLTAGHVRQKLLSLADICGEGAEARKTAVLAALLRAVPPGAGGASELKWLVRTCVPHMSAGISLAGSVLPALASAAAIQGGQAAASPADADAAALETDAAAICASARAGEVAAPGVVARPPAAPVRLPPPTELKAAQEAVRALYALRPDVGDVVRILKDARGDWRAVRRQCTLRAGVPCSPMLAKPATTIRDALARCPLPLTAEYKYDGQRAQVHCDASGAVSIFSRKLDSMTDKYPEVRVAHPCHQPSFAPSSPTIFSSTFYTK
jgi:DNA ligase-1